MRRASFDGQRMRAKGKKSLDEGIGGVRMDKEGSRPSLYTC